MSKISELSDGGSLQSTDYLIAVRSGGNVKVRPNGAVSGTTGQFSTSLNVDGTVTADGLTVDGAATIDGGATDNTVLTLDSSTANTYLKITDSNSTNGTFIGATTDDLNFYPNNTLSAKFASGGDISFYEDTGTTPKFFWDASAERLGIGTATPGGPLEVTVASGTSGSASGFRLISADGGGYAVYPTSAVANPVWNTNVNSGEQISWSVGGSEKARLDASGNLLVGKTASDTSSAGHELRSGSFAAHTVDGDVALNLRRLNSDGAIARFQKDGSTVGSIGASSGDLYIGTGDTTLLFVDGVDLVIPTGSGGATRDAAISLGNASNRFKDLYLSGGVYLGGTGAANLLDDYEEGTFTPTDNNIGAYTNSYGRYTKIGNLVHCFGYFTVQSNSNGNNADLIPPFTYGFSAQTATIGTVLTSEAGNYYLKSTSNSLFTIVDEDEVVQTLADFSTKTVHFNVTFHVA